MVNVAFAWLFEDYKKQMCRLFLYHYLLYSVHRFFWQISVKQIFVKESKLFGNTNFLLSKPRQKNATPPTIFRNAKINRPVPNCWKDFGVHFKFW